MGLGDMRRPGKEVVGGGEGTCIRCRLDRPHRAGYGPLCVITVWEGIMLIAACRASPVLSTPPCSPRRRCWHGVAPSPPVGCCAGRTFRDSTPKQYTDIYVHVRTRPTAAYTRWRAARPATPHTASEPTAAAAPRSTTRSPGRRRVSEYGSTSRCGARVAAGIARRRSPRIADDWVNPPVGGSVPRVRGQRLLDWIADRRRRPRPFRGQRDQAENPPHSHSRRCRDPDAARADSPDHRRHHQPGYRSI